MKIRQAQRNLKCRGCSRSVEKGEKVFHQYSSANKGMNIFFCMECMEEISRMFILEKGFLSVGIEYTGIEQMRYKMGDAE